MAGLVKKHFVIRLNDDARKHEHCKFFALDLTHDADAQKAALHYAELTNNHELRAELVRWIDGERNHG